MDADHSQLDPIYERFNQAVMKAIVNSREVKALLKEFGDQGYINESSVFNLFLSLEELDEYMNPKSPHPESAPSPGPREDRRALETDREEPRDPQPESHLWIDGRRLTETEARFLEYCARHFDERQWLKKVRLKL